MATGDLKGCLRKLDQLLRSINYSREVDYPGLARGDPVSVLPIISYAFNSFSLLLAEHFVECGVELTGKNDLRLVEGVYKVLRDHFHYKPVLSKQQFLQSGYAERRIAITCDIITYLINKHKELSKSQLKKRLPSVPSSAPSQGGHERLFPDLPYKTKPLVEKHVVGFVDSRPRSPSSHCDSEFVDDDDDDSLLPRPTKAPCVQEVSVCRPVLRSQSLGVDGIERPAGCFTSSAESSRLTVPPLCGSEVTAMAEDTQLQDLRQQLSECQEKIQKLSVMEERLWVVEEEMKGKVIIDRLEWDNLVSRLVLLETEWILSSTKNDSSLNRVTGSPTLPPEAELDQDTTLDSRSKTPESRHHNSSGYDSILSTDAAHINSLVLTEVSKACAKEPLSQSSSRGASASLSLVQSHARERLHRIGHL
ncbi:CEP44 protein, partial [Polypterus senegalus]